MKPPLSEIININISDSKPFSFYEEFKQISEKVREAARLAEKFEYMGTCEYLDKLADELEGNAREMDQKFQTENGFWPVEKKAGGNRGSEQGVD